MINHPLLGIPVHESSIIPEDRAYHVTGELFVPPSVMRELKRQAGYTDQDFIHEDFQKRLDGIKNTAKYHRNKLDAFREHMHQRIDSKFFQLKRIGTFNTTGTLFFEKDEEYIRTPIKMPTPFMLAKPGILSV